MSTEKTINSTIRTNLLNNEDFLYAHLVKFERPFNKKSDGTFDTGANRYAYYTDGSTDIAYDDGSGNGTQVYKANRILSVGNYSETTQARASAMNLTLAGEDIKPSISLAGSISTSGVFTPTSATYEGYPLDFVERGFKEGDKLTFSYDSSSILTYIITSFTTNNTVLNLALTGSDSIDSAFPSSTLSKTFSIQQNSEELIAPLQDRGVSLVTGTSLASPNFINRSVMIYKVFIDPETGTPWGSSAITIFKGVIQSVKIDESEKTVKVSWSLTSHWGDWNQVGGRLTTDELHRNIQPSGEPNPVQPIRNEYASDLGFLHAESSLSAIANYTTKQTKYKMKTKKRGGFAGLFGGTKQYQVEYQVDMQNEVDLNIHLQGKYLPVVYGVQRINGNPVFADTLNSNSKVIYTADAICEGEIHGLFNMYIDDIPVICTDDNDFDVRGPGGSDEDNTQLQCFGRMSHGDTMGGKEQEYSEQATGNAFNMAGKGFFVDVGNGFGAVWVNGGFSLPFNGSMGNNIPTLATGEIGVGHRKSWSISSPFNIQSSLFHGRPNQLASSMLVTPTIQTDGINSVTINNNGYGYTSNPTVTISAPAGGGTTATATVIRSNDDEGDLRKVGTITVTNQGSGYNQGEEVTVTISGGGGYGARATANRGGYKRQNDYYTGRDPYWSSNHRLLDTAYSANRFEVTADNTELPEVEYVVKGSVLDCYNYDNTYIPDEVLGSGNNHTQFKIGELVSVQYSTDGSSWTTDTTGNFSSGKFKIMDKFLFQTNRQVSHYKFRLDKTPSLGTTNGAPSRTRVRLVNSSNQTWHMITWNHTLCTNETFPNEFKDPTWSVTSEGKLVATFANNSDAEAVGKGDDTNSYQFLSSGGWTDMPNLQYSLLMGTWSGNAITFPTSAIGLNVTPFNSKVTIRSAKHFNMSQVSSVANVSNASELLNTYTDTDFEGDTKTYVGRGAMLQNTTTNEEREIQAFNTSTNTITVVTPFYTPPTSSHKFTITGRGADKRASINPAIQTLDYLRNKRYGKGLNDEDLDINSFISSAQLCDSRSNAIISVKSTSNVVAGAIYALKTGGNSNSGEIVAEGEVGSGVNDITSNTVTLTKVINKFTKRYSTQGSYTQGDIIYTSAGNYYRADTTVTNTSATEPTHTNTTNGMIYIGKANEGQDTNTILLHKTSGSGPDTLQIEKRYGNPIEYSLYDSDWVKYWRYYGWDRNNQAEVTRHQTNFILDTGKSQFENINSMLSHFNGILSYENGKYVLDVETQEDAPTISLNSSQENINPYYIENSDIIGKISLKDDSQKKGKNTIKSSVADPQNNWGSRSITFFNSDFLKADRDIVKTGNFPFTGITNYWNGRVNVEKELFQSRFSKEVSFTIGARGLLLKVGQVISLNYDPFGWSNKLFRIENLSFQQNCTVTVKSREYDDSIYEITKQQALAVAQNSSANFSINPLQSPTLTSVSTNKSGSVIIEWTNGNDFDEITDSTEIFASADNNRSNSILIATVDNEETFTYTTAVATTKYYWVRHRRVIQNPKRLLHSPYNPVSKTNGTIGTALSISSSANTIKLIPSSHVIDYSRVGAESTTVTFTTQTINMTGTVFYEFLVGSTSKANTTTSTFTLADTDEPAVDGIPIQVTVKARQGSTSGTLLAQDVVSIFSVQDGQSTVTGILTNESHTIPADLSGNVSSSDLSSAGGTFQVYYGNALQNGNVADNKISFSVASANGCSVAINENSGAYTVSAVSANGGTAVFSVTLEGSLVGGTDNTNDVTITKVYSIGKAVAGATGDSGIANAIVYAYQRSASNVTSNPGAVTVSLAGSTSGTITTSNLANSWLKAIPSGTNDLYVVAATASGTGTTDSIAATEWSSPVVLTQTGTDGLNTATVNLYQRTANASAPSAGSNGTYDGNPEGNSTYTFSNSTLSFTTANGWSLTNPGINDSNPYLWIIHATAASTGTTDVIAESEWSQAVILSQKGDIGATGSGGKVVRLFADDYSIVYDAAGSNPSPSTSTDILLTATTQNITNPFFKFTGDGFTDESSYTDGASAVHDTFTFPVPASHFTSPQTVKVSVQEGSSGGEVASDTISIFAVKPGADGASAYTVICSNEAHAIPANADGSSPSMGGSGTSFEVFIGATQLTGITSGTPNSSQFKVTVTDDTNITVGSQSAGSNLITFADHTSMSAATASITYSVLIQNTTTIVKKQTFSRTNTGAAGNPGAAGASSKVVFYRKSGSNTARYTTPSAPSGNITATSIVNQWGVTFVAPDANNVVWQSLGNSSDGTNWTWGAPFLYLNWDEIETGFTKNLGWNLYGTTPFAFLNFAENNYLNSNVSIPTVPDSTTGGGAPSATKANGSTYLQTDPNPDVLWVRIGGQWVSTAGINSDTIVDTSSFITGIDSSAVNNALGYTPFNIAGIGTPGTGEFLKWNGSAYVWSVDNNTQYSAGSFDITDLDGYSDANYLNASVTNAYIFSMAVTANQTSAWSSVNGTYTNQPSTVDVVVTATNATTVETATYRWTLHDTANSTADRISVSEVSDSTGSFGFTITGGWSNTGTNTSGTVQTVTVTHDTGPTITFSGQIITGGSK